MSFTVENKFNIGQEVFIRRFDNAVTNGKVISITGVITTLQKPSIITYGIEVVNGKNIRTEYGFNESVLFAASSEAFMLRNEN
jgi:hypothetical protein